MKRCWNSRVSCNVTMVLRVKADVNKHLGSMIAGLFNCFIWFYFANGNLTRFSIFLLNYTFMNGTHSIERIWLKQINCFDYRLLAFALHFFHCQMWRDIQDSIRVLENSSSEPECLFKIENHNTNKNLVSKIWKWIRLNEETVQNKTR